MPQHLILLAFAPDGIEPEYGWIEPGARLGSIGEHRFHKVQQFVEKPNANLARQMMLRQGLWNTLILAAKVETLWALGWQSFPEMMRLFERYAGAIGTSREEDVREAIYGRMPSRNFSSHLLQCLPQRVVVMEMTGLQWSDWGRPQRIVDTLQRIGKMPTFSLEHAVAV